MFSKLNYCEFILSTEINPEESTDNPYHAIAVTILACFCTDQDLVTIQFIVPNLSSIHIPLGIASSSDLQNSSIQRLLI